MDEQIPPSPSAQGMRFARNDGKAVAWEFWRRHRWGFIAIGVYSTVLAAIKLVIVERGQIVHLDSSVSFALVDVVPLSVTFAYFIGVFTFGFAGDAAGRQSMYPPRMFALPVTTAALAGWPLVYGSVAMAVWWLVSRLLAVWPSGITVPVLWPALLAASLLAWTQVFVWMPYPLPGMRIIAAILWLTAIQFIVQLALRYNAGEPVMVAILAPHVPLAYLAARFAVARARRGDIPDWRGVFARLGRIADALSHRRAAFSSAASAQSWLEWRQRGTTLPVWVGILVPLELALLWITGNTAPLVFTILAGVLLTPPFMAAFTGATVGQSSPFSATRPLSNTELLAAKLKTTVQSTLAAWLLVVVVIPLALKLSGTAPLVLDYGRRTRDGIGTPRAIVLVLLIVVGLIGVTWKQLVQSLYIGMSGRPWVGKTTWSLTLVFLAVLGPLADWIASNGTARGALWYSLPWILGALAGAKMSAAVWIATRLYRTRALSDRALVAGAACWCGAVLGLYAVLAWFFATPFIGQYLLVLVAILAIPLVRLSAAPIALAWNRHR